MDQYNLLHTNDEEHNQFLLLTDSSIQTETSPHWCSNCNFVTWHNCLLPNAYWPIL